AVAEIIEAPDLHINEGSTLRLECKLKRATESPLYVFWYVNHSRMQINDTQPPIDTPFHCCLPSPKYPSSIQLTPHPIFARLGVFAVRRNL
uniref:Uncharacterized protein n=1 Tax=Phlebotomus papatasi TaxID=29031 RepID=A0A1B0DQZ6_PHLPP